MLKMSTTAMAKQHAKGLLTCEACHQATHPKPCIKPDCEGLIHGELVPAEIAQRPNPVIVQNCDTCGARYEDLHMLQKQGSG
jgi:hypothetical protein